MLGVTSASTPAQTSAPSSYYYCVERLPDGRIARRGITSMVGIPQNGLILGPSTLYRFWLLEASTGLCGYTDFETPTSGFPFEVPTVSLSRSRSPDLDGDGLTGDAEFVAGTDPFKADTDGDGVGDFAEMRQGLDPLDGLTVRTGVLGATDTPGDAWDVFALDDIAVVADGADGISVFNIFNRMPPLLIGRAAVPGSSRRVAFSDRRAAVAAGASGLAIVDLSTPPVLPLTHVVPLIGAVRAVAAEGGVAYAGTEAGEFAVVDLLSGTILQRRRLGERIDDIVPDGDLLRVLGASTLWTLARGEDGFEVVTQTAFPGSAVQGERTHRLALGPALLYANDFESVMVFDTTVPRSPVLVTRNPVGAGGVTVGGINQLVANGAGLGLAALATLTGFGASDDIGVYDLGTGGTNLGLFTVHPTPGPAKAVALYNGLAYVADGLSGLQAVNYLAYDQGSRPPTVRLEGAFDPDHPAIEENHTFHLTAQASDDVQVRNVEFFLNGRRMVTDGNFPFSTRLRSPALTDSTVRFTLSARATDTGGNASWSQELTVQLLPDSTPPALTRTLPAEGAVAGETDTLVAFVDEPLDPATLTAESFYVRSPGPDGILGTTDDTDVTGELRYDEDQLAVFLTLPTPLGQGGWEGVFGRQVTDRKGNRRSREAHWRFWINGGTDTDLDGLPDAVELAMGLDPTQPDSDGDGILDGDEDQDTDQLPNAWELVFGLDPQKPDSNANGLPDGQEDPDGDALTTLQEYQARTNPTLADTDGDGWNDEAELTGRGDPLDPSVVPFRWVGDGTAVDVAVHAFGPGSGATVGLVPARPTTTVLVSQAPPTLAGGALTVARPPAAVLLSRAEPSWLNSGATVARPAITVTAPPSRVNPANGHRYYLLHPLTWPEAEAAAVALGGHLVTVDDQAEQDWIVANFSLNGSAQRDLWTGLRDPDEAHNASTSDARRAEFQWVSGASVTYSNWYPGQPDNYFNAEYHTLMISAQNNPWAQSPNWRWNDAHAGTLAYGVAEVNP